MATATEADAMRRAIMLAARGLGRTSPNPVVGCVILDAAGRIVGEGWHQQAGGPHAEIHALRAAGNGPGAAPPSSPSNPVTTPAVPAPAPRP